MQAYRIEKIVGEGSFGKALLCVRKTDTKKCIIKQISLSKMGRKEALQTEQEARLLSRLNHPNIVTFWESFQETSQGKLNLYIVMEFADGGDLSNLIQARKNRLMSENQVLNIGVQISLALKHVHDRKILHRDLKSQNIFLTAKGIVKLGDFGIARVLRNTGELASTQIGTPYFMSPEILAGKRYNNKTDIWSLGCVVYELMALKVPFQGSSMKQLVSNIINSPMPSLSSQYNNELRSLVKTMLAKNYKERPSINTILNSNIMRDKIGMILSDHLKQREFCHTVLHGDDIFQSGIPTPPSNLNPPLLRPPLIAQPQPITREENNFLPKRSPIIREEESHRQRKDILDQQSKEKIREMQEAKRRQDQELQKIQIQPIAKREKVQADHRKFEHDKKKGPSIPQRDPVSKGRIRPILKPAVPKRDQISKKDFVCPPSRFPAPAPEILHPDARERWKKYEQLKIDAKKIELSPNEVGQEELNNRKSARPIKVEPHLISDVRAREYEQLKIDTKKFNSPSEREVRVKQQEPNVLVLPIRKSERRIEVDLPQQEAISPSDARARGNWFKDLEIQMGVLKSKIHDLQSPALKVGNCFENKDPPSQQISNRNPLIKLSKNPVPTSEEQLEVRKQRREIESKNFRQFVKAQRKAKSLSVDKFEMLGSEPSPTSEPCPQTPPPSDVIDEPYFCANSPISQDLLQDFMEEQSPVEKLRARRDQEREELRRLIAEKRKEKHAKSKQKVLHPITESENCEPASLENNCTTKSNLQSQLPTQNTPSQDPLMGSSFFQYSVNDLNSIQSNKSQGSENLSRECCEDYCPTSPFDNLADNINTFPRSPVEEASSTTILADQGELQDIEYDDLLLAMKDAIEIVECNDEEFEEESLTEDLKAEEGAHWTSVDEDFEAISDDSWDDSEGIQEDSDTSSYELTVFGVPFPLSESIRHKNGLKLDNNTPASRMEALREFLENELGIEIFIKVYRLLKSVEAKDDDDELLSSLETILGVERLHYMDTFIQLINIEDKFESGE